MEKRIFFLFLALCLVACSKDFVEVEPKPIVTPNPAKEYLEREGLRPSDIDSINSISGKIKKEDYTIILGSKSNKPWLSKFDQTGNEIYCIDIEENKYNSEYGHFYEISGSFEKNGFMLFGIVYKSHESNSESLGHSIASINIESGKIYKIKDLEDLGSHGFLTSSNNRSLAVIGKSVIERKKIIMYGDKWDVLWERELKDSEDCDIYDDYGNQSLIVNDNEIFVYKDYNRELDPNWVMNGNIKYINVKDYKLIKEFDKEEFDFPKEPDMSELDFFVKHTFSIDDNGSVFFLRDKIEKIKDPISGKEEPGKFLKRYIYRIDTKDLSVKYVGNE